MPFERTRSVTEYYNTLNDPTHDDILEEQCQTMIESLGCDGTGRSGAKVVHIRKTEHGYRFVELCDEYYGVTLNQDQMERFIKELQALAGIA